ncbi:hypothetical protein HELRODRAFT_62827 [Helobdella robusta]|uniref:Pecanex-like protein n=1 Tax=Helobdella robusta TaxID=6412 RepID=T1FX55_HELRO|nr:hypothetical protein HELRODRAFT_62827 [Helobdella robusta]ESO12874.1 hypothetical protein HELRODRAFT_62827 [Helobdella robusta]
MGNISVIMRQGIVASLTGGWVYEPQQENLSNALHLYMWIFLLAYPLVLYMVSSFSVKIWILYCLSILIFFTVIKLLNYKLHAMFDSKDTKIIVPDESSMSTSESMKLKQRSTKASLEQPAQLNVLVLLVLQLCYFKNIFISLFYYFFCVIYEMIKLNYRSH